MSTNPWSNWPLWRSSFGLLKHHYKNLYKKEKLNRCLLDQSNKVENKNPRRSSFPIETIHGKLFILASIILLSNVVSGGIGVRPQTNGIGVVTGTVVPSNERKLHIEFFKVTYV